MKLSQLCFAAVAALAVLGAQASAQIDTNLITSGNINTASNWDNGLPGGGQTGLVNIDSNFPNTSGASVLDINGTVIFGDNTLPQITLTALTDVVASNPDELVFNNVTVDVTDDIFSGSGGNLTFNTGSITNVGDDFEANGAIVATAGNTFINVNGGTHNVNDQFGAQRGTILNFFGGDVTSNGFRTTAGNAAIPAGGTINIGGDATIDANLLSLDASGFIDFSSNWTGSLDLADRTSFADWFSVLDSTTATFDGAALTQAVFDDNFQFTNGALSLQTAAIPEPSSLAFLGLGVFGLLTLRRRN